MKHEMNLLPVNPVKKKRSDKTISKGVMLFSGALLGVLIIYGFLTFLEESCQTEIRQLEMLIENKAEYQVIYTNLNQQKAILEHRQLLLETISSGKALPHLTMLEINKVLPAGMLLSNYDYQEGRLIISGETKKKEEIFEFKEKLANLAVFEMINMVSTTRKNDVSTDKITMEETWEFTLDIQIAEV
ncbi:PilN domain-containing protein [Acetobacterium wieringae]|uniref:PilN domain-containing protein n=1 Tax=Acetobacterium wieringae TaxID=52694 RepID=A0ABY6HJL9_9FIRM|nr:MULTISPECIES: PilN domain-containing protein [Acetobacterium]UYO63701.1 PilN domain-containing protein [Acetobacterium wieringae]VUZ27477.1 Uncharacterised protein [Acetobacterium wieringae]